MSLLISFWSQLEIFYEFVLLDRSCLGLLVENAGSLFLLGTGLHESFRLGLLILVTDLKFTSFAEEGVFFEGLIVFFLGSERVVLLVGLLGVIFIILLIFVFVEEGIASSLALRVFKSSKG